MNFFTDKTDNIRNTITNVDSKASSTSASFIAPKEKLLCFTTIGEDELNKHSCELANYRPISNIPFMSKIFEKVVSAQLCSFLQKMISMKNFSQI